METSFSVSVKDKDRQKQYEIGKTPGLKYFWVRILSPTPHSYITLDNLLTSKEPQFIYRSI